jgi:predicted transcriptional regulator
MNNALHIPQSLLKRLDKISTESHTTPEAIIKSALADRLDYEEWLLERVDAGIADVDAGRTYTREAMLKKLGVGSGRKKAA